MGYKSCTQCQRYFLAKRSTATYCGSKCRQRANRGKKPLAWWREEHIDGELSGDDKLDQFIQDIAANHPEAYEHLTYIRDKFGHRHMYDAIYTAMLLIDGRK